MPIADEIKQSRPFRSRSQEAAMSMLRTSNLLRRKFEELVLTEGITLQQYNVLRILRGARAPLPTMEIAARLIEQAPGITRHVNNLEEKGFIRREPWPGDRRQVLCRISSAGLKLLERLDPPMNELDDAVTAPLNSEQIDTLIDLLERIRANPLFDEA
jgi:DNA-binding MarR family transcriptional regulator